MRNEEMDLLRAAIVFTASGVDACCTILLRDALPTLIHRHPGAKQHYEAFYRRDLNQPADGRALHRALTGSNPSEQLIEYYVNAKTRSSLQGSGDLLQRVRSPLAIPNEVVPKERFTALDSFFQARNQIVHNMDYRSLEEAVARPKTGSTRIRRSPTVVASQCGQAIDLVADLIHATASQIQKPKQ